MPPVANVKTRLEQLLADALVTLKTSGFVPADADPAIGVERTRDASHGDFATNLAMQLAKPARRKPREIADALVAALPADPSVREVVIAGPGFINFFQADGAQSEIVRHVLDQRTAFGRSAIGAGQRVQVEFVSANPTGPLHVGHGRGAALGASVANLLDAVGFDVQREYYVNDAGRQMDILAASVWLRYLEAAGTDVSFPVNGYRGDYIHRIAEDLRTTHGGAFVRPADAVLGGLPADEGAGGGDKEAYIDAVIARMRDCLGDNAYRLVFDAGLDAILADIKNDLGEFGVEFDEWFSERGIQSDVAAVIERLVASGHVYEQDGMQWFRSTDFGDDKDRVVVRSNGQSTYFASDIAYVVNKLERGFERIVYIFGADHHGYTTRVKAACEALGYDAARLEFLLIQFAILYRGGERLQMSTRSGSFVTIRELRDEVGRDAARFFYVMRKHSQHLDFDLDLAKSQTTDNPVYYVQYAHARICSVERQLGQRGLAFDREVGLGALDRLSEATETALFTSLATWPEVVERAALAREPHQVTGYLRDLAHGLHSHYNAHKVLVDDATLRDARLCLLFAVRQVLANGLDLLGVSAPEVM